MVSTQAGACHRGQPCGEDSGALPGEERDVSWHRAQCTLTAHPAPSSGGRSTGHLCSSLGSSSRGGHRNDLRAGSPLPSAVGTGGERWGCSAGRREVESPGKPYRGLSMLGGACKEGGTDAFGRACCDGTRGDGVKLQEAIFSLDNGRNFVPCRWRAPGPCGPQSWPQPLRWRHGRPGWSLVPGPAAPGAAAVPAPGRACAGEPCGGAVRAPPAHTRP